MDKADKSLAKLRWFFHSLQQISKVSRCMYGDDAGEGFQTFGLFKTLYTLLATLQLRASCCPFSAVSCILSVRTRQWANGRSRSHLGWRKYPFACRIHKMSQTPNSQEGWANFQKSLQAGYFLSQYLTHAAPDISFETRQRERG